METFLECETTYREPPPVHVFVGNFGGNRSKESGRNGAWFTSHKIVTILGDPIGYRIADNDSIGYWIADKNSMKILTNSERLNQAVVWHMHK